MSHKAKNSPPAHLQLRQPSSHEGPGKASAGCELPRGFFAHTDEEGGFLSFRDTVFAVFCDDDMLRLADEE